MNSDNFHAGADTKKTNEHEADNQPISSPAMSEAPSHEVANVTPAATTLTSQPTEEPAHPANTPQNPNTPGIIILQWLTYAFWGWLIVGLIWLVALIFANIITEDTEYVIDMLPYAIAGTIVLLPIALTCDLLYRKKEPTKKTGGASVIMIIHAVLFALLGIAALITAVFTFINMSLNTYGGNDAQQVTIFTALSATLLYALTFARTLQPLKKSLSLIYTIIMSSLTVVLICIAVAGPVLSSAASKEDRLIENNISSIHYSLETYVYNNAKLPKSLNELEVHNPDADMLAKSGKVELIPRGSFQQPLGRTGNSYKEVLRYELCVVYKSEKGYSSSRSYYDYSGSKSEGEYNSNLLASPHKAGRVCYKQYAPLSPENNSQTPVVEDKQKEEPKQQ